MALLVTSIHFVPQIAILTPFRAPIPANLHLHRFGFKLGKDQK